MPTRAIPTTSILAYKSNQVMGTQNFDKKEVLLSKIDWATGELASPSNINNLKYCIELCELIRVASEAILALQKIE